ncbi:YNL040W [Saccharomyces arboricola H-6]|uniref:YNL040W n=1 Tax=Saccharomyces arboricola (strain H-6 / AS 2.3317 / CBS 10644) TaxID=1160507 RepID=J8PIM6_SACAR|nr:YNL040W [Saccharomyces arboricola H-6]
MKPVMVGALACQRDSFLFDRFKTLVVSCEPKKDKDSITKGYEIELQDTILFPEGGGQPSDSGFLKIVEGNDSSSINKKISVSHVSRSGLYAKHHVKEPIEPGVTVEITIDEVKRLDCMQQHTGQHLLSAVLENKYKVNTVSWSMGGIVTEKKPVLEPSDYFNYIELNRKLTEIEVTEISDDINRLIINFPQEITVVERVSEDDASEVNVSKMPDDYDLSKGVLRTIHIGNIDSNPCCGTHLKSTSQIGSILIITNQTAVRGSNSRLYFMCGKRVADHAKSIKKILSNSKELFRCSESQVPEKTERQCKQLQQLNKREQYWIRKLARFVSEDLKSTLEASEKKRAYFMEEEFGTLELLLQVFKELFVYLKEKFEVYEIIICGYERQTGTGSLLILSESGEKIFSLVAKLGSLLQNLKGGGGKNGGKWQGKITSISNAEFAALTNYLSHDFISC